MLNPRGLSSLLFQGGGIHGQGGQEWIRITWWHRLPPKQSRPCHGSIQLSWIRGAFPLSQSGWQWSATEQATYLVSGYLQGTFPGMNCKLAMDNLAEEWARLQKGTDYGLRLDDFLLGDDDVPTEGDYDDDTEPKSKRAKTCKWETAHEEYKKMKQVPCPYHCNWQLVFFKFFQFMQIKMTLWSREPWVTSKMGQQVILLVTVPFCRVSSDCHVTWFDLILYDVGRYILYIIIQDFLIIYESLIWYWLIL